MTPLPLRKERRTVGLYDSYEYIKVKVEDGIALVTIECSTFDRRGHWEYTQVWRDFDRDPDARVAVFHWSGGRAPEAEKGIDILEDLVARPPEDKFARVVSVMREAVAAVYEPLSCEKPTISAINAPAIGAGLAAALLADISIIAETVQILDGHVQIGMAAGDHAALWPVFCSLAKARLYLLANEPMDGKEAERIGLVSRAVPSDQVLPVAMAYARKLANAPQFALRLTKRALNQYLRMASIVSYDLSAAYQLMTLLDVDVQVAVKALRTKEWPEKFPSVDTAGPVHT
ncbi:MAG: enoyl-CoA hydratase [Chloroflexi bacterium]|nr:enoyl-CoA hydratase [Chloroflexota bacterium]